MPWGLQWERRRTSDLKESAGSGRGWSTLWAGGVWLKAPQKRLAAELGSRDEWGGCDVRWSIVLVETAIPVRAAAASWAGECGAVGGGAAEALL